VLAVAETFIGEERKLLVGGSFTVINAVNRNHVARLNDDGTTDMAFDPASRQRQRLCIAVQADGRAVIGGDFTTVNGTGRNHLARLNTDGSLDLSFDPGTAANESVRAIAIQLDGRILIGGSFTNYNGTAMNHLPGCYPTARWTPRSLRARGLMTRSAPSPCSRHAHHPGRPVHPLQRRHPQPPHPPQQRRHVDPTITSARAPTTSSPPPSSAGQPDRSRRRLHGIRRSAQRVHHPDLRRFGGRAPAGLSISRHVPGR